MHALSARNHFGGVVERVRIDGLLAQVEIEVTEPATLTAIITRAAAEELGLRPGVAATGVVKATSVMVER
jgi:molybdopterin-binding protein